MNFCLPVPSFQSEILQLKGCFFVGYKPFTLFTRLLQGDGQNKFCSKPYQFMYEYSCCKINPEDLSALIASILKTYDLD